MSKQETVEVTLRLPKALVDFLEIMEGDIKEYLTHTIVDLHMSYVEGLDAKMLMQVFKLTPVFKEYGVLPSYYGDP